MATEIVKIGAMMHAVFFLLQLMQHVCLISATILLAVWLILLDRIVYVVFLMFWGVKIHP